MKRGDRDARIEGTDFVFKRKHRWTLEGPGLPDTWVQAARVQYVSKIINIFYIGVVNDPAFDPSTWPETLEGGDNKFVLTYYDGCGTVLETHSFSDVKLVEHVTKVDYKSISPVVHKVTASFGEKWIKKNVV